MAYTYNKLRGRIVEKYGTQKRFADELGMTKQAMSKKMLGQTGFNQADIERWCNLLDINRSDIALYFFT